MNVRAIIYMKFSQFDALMLVWIAEYIGYKAMVNTGTKANN